MRKFALLLVMVSIAACKASTTAPSTDSTGSDDTSATTDSGAKKKKTTAKDSGTSTAGDGGQPSNCPAYEAPKKLATFTSTALTESSGLVASRKNPGVLWSHNDSGNTSSLFAVSATDAHVIAQYTVQGAINDSTDDWEDIAFDATTGDIVIADIGDNNAVRSDIRLYRIAEPTVSASASGLTGTLPSTMIPIAYPDGAHNAESFVIDADHNEGYIFTKGDNSVLYKIDLASTANPIVMTKLSERVFNKEVLGKLATAADLGEAGLLIRTYTYVYFFPREAGDTVDDMFKKTPCVLPSASVADEVQAEAIAWAADESGFYTNSEKINSALDFTKKK